MVASRRPRSRAQAPPTVPNRSRGELTPAWEPHPLPADLPLRAVRWVQGDTANDRLHQHDAFEIGYCHAGSGTWVVEDKVFRFGAGCVVTVNHRELHLACSDPGTTSEWTYLFVDPLRLLPGLGDEEALDTTALCGPGYPNVLDPSAHPATCALAAALVAEAEGAAPGRRAALRGLVLALLARLHRLPRGRQRDRRPAPAGLARLAPALRLIASRPGDACGIAGLARACGMGASTFRRAFVAGFGLSPREYLARCRVHRAMQALRDPGVGVLEAALAAGFDNASAFARRFRAITGRTPSAWRRGPSAAVTARPHRASRPRHRS